MHVEILSHGAAVAGHPAPARTSSLAAASDKGQRPQQAKPAGKRDLARLIRCPLSTGRHLKAPFRRIKPVQDHTDLHPSTIPAVSGSDIDQLADVPSLPGKQLWSWRD